MDRDELISAWLGATVVVATLAIMFVALAIYIKGA
jgi:hypothetical protein